MRTPFREREAGNLDPFFANALYNRARAQEFAGNDDSAIKDYGRALELTPHDADTFGGRGVPYPKKG